MGLFLLCCAIGICLNSYGIRIWKDGKIWLLPKGLCQKITEENRFRFCESIGKAICLFGVGIMMAGILYFISDDYSGWIVFGVLTLISTLIVVRAMTRFNR